MKATLLLTEVLLVVVLGGTFSSAKTLNSLESNENSAFDKRWNEDRAQRDLGSFLTQMFYATSLSFGSCASTLCTNNVSPDLCQAFCQTNTTAFQQILTTLNSCYMDGGLCGQNFSVNTLTNVNVSLGVDSYDGQCTLYGSEVTMTLANVSMQIFDLGIPTIAGYNGIFLLPYTFEGLSVQCRPNLPSPSPPQTNANQNVSQSSNQNDGFSFVRHLLIIFGVNVDEFDSQNGASLVDKRQAESTSVVYESSVSVSLNIRFQPVFIYYPGGRIFERPGQSVPSTSVTLGSGVGGGGIPSEYQAQVELGIENLFYSYLIYDFRLTSNYYQTIDELLSTFRFYNCSSTCSS